MSKEKVPFKVTGTVSELGSVSHMIKAEDSEAAIEKFKAAHSRRHVLTVSAQRRNMSKEVAR